MELLFPELKALYQGMLDSKLQLLKPVASLSGLGIAFQPRLDLNQQQQLKKNAHVVRFERTTYRLTAGGTTAVLHVNEIDKARFEVRFTVQTPKPL